MDKHEHWQAKHQRWQAQAISQQAAAAIAGAAGNPNHLLDTMKRKLHLSDDKALARRLRVTGHVITMLREGRMKISASMMLWLREASGMSIPELRELLGDRRASFRLTCK